MASSQYSVLRTLLFDNNAKTTNITTNATI